MTIVYHSLIRIREMYIYIYIYIYRTYESQNTKNTYDFLVQVRNFLLPLSLNVLWHKERDTHFFYSGFSTRLPISCDTCPRPPRASESQPSSPGAGLNSTNILQNFQNPPRASGAWRHSHSLTPFPIWAIVTSLSDTSAPRTRAWTPVLMLHLSNPCTEPKGSQPN